MILLLIDPLGGVIDKLVMAQAPAGRLLKLAQERVEKNSSPRLDALLLVRPHGQEEVVFKRQRLIEAALRLGEDLSVNRLSGSDGESGLARAPARRPLKRAAGTPSTNLANFFRLWRDGQVEGEVIWNI